ncbi:hypothetical protein B0A55_01738 [Friedmanniomyces simplex]|uniref:SprT-like domain-containing protein n=1 Tax=Friedmanniomyces simplex TaxID=329884 RepID=A0A4V5NKT1_9PEZI|nr:hypothetical protein B0A55_01738 [Friedmanniomyces simplex]
MKKSDFHWGWQEDKERMGKEDGSAWEGARVYVTSSTSGLSASLRPAEKEAIWKPFGKWVKGRRKERFGTEGRLSEGMVEMEAVGAGETIMRNNSVNDDVQYAESLLRRKSAIARYVAEDASMPAAETKVLRLLTREAVRRKLLLPLPQPPAQQSRGCTCPLCKPALYASLPLVHPRDTDLSIKMRGLRPGAHPAWSLAVRAVRSFSREERRRGESLRWGQLRATDEWAARWDQGRSAAARQLRSLGLRETIPHPGSFFRKPAEIFNQMFFLGAMPPRQIRIAWGLDQSRLYGITVSRSTIVLNPQMKLHKLAPTAVLCTILHEMIHAFLGLYNCYGGEGSSCGDEVCAHLSADNLGGSGHGRAWQYMAQGIEAEMSRLLGFSGRLGRQECAVKEIAALGFRPSKCDLRTLYNDFDVATQEAEDDWCL